MPVFLLSDDLVFPAADLAEDGLLAVGGDLRPERLIQAYEHGIFPWYSEGEPILWHSPDPRFVLTAERLRISRSLERRLRRQEYRLTLDQRFREVVAACAAAPRPDQDGTWITDEMQQAYAALHEQGLAHSAEAWLGDELVGGLYGVSLGAAYFGESMFSRSPDASKVAFVRLIEQLKHWGIRLIDCQVRTQHLARFGAEDWRRPRYLRALHSALKYPTRKGHWHFENI